MAIFAFLSGPHGHLCVFVRTTWPSLHVCQDHTAIFACLSGPHGHLCMFVRTTWPSLHVCQDHTAIFTFFLSLSLYTPGCSPLLWRSHDHTQHSCVHSKVSLSYRFCRPYSRAGSESGIAIPARVRGHSQKEEYNE